MVFLLLLFGERTFHLCPYSIPVNTVSMSATHAELCVCVQPFPGFFNVIVTTWHFTRTVSFNAHSKTKSQVLLSQLHNEKPVYSKRKSKISNGVKTDLALPTPLLLSYIMLLLEVACNFCDFCDPFTPRVSASRSQSSISTTPVSRRWDYLAESWWWCVGFLWPRKIQCNLSELNFFRCEIFDQNGNPLQYSCL